MGTNKEFKILLIGQEHEYFVTSIKREMEQRNYKVEICPPVVSTVNQACEKAKICLLYVEAANTLKEMFAFLKENAYEKKIEVCLVGDKGEVNQAEKTIGVYNVGKKFLRPVDAKEISDGLEILYEKSLKNNERKSILIIDDEPECLRRTQQILHNQYKTYVANSGLSAAMLLAKHHVNLILLDYYLPVVDGSKILKMLKTEPATADIPVIFLSGIEDEEAVKYTKKLGAEGYIYKNSAAEKLATTISDYFAKNDWNNYKKDNSVDIKSIWK